ncbi:MAG TPA: hypothetical protein PL045_02790 [Chitinophagaceae bacterium]|nr:hypothetical protein [Chitinophagaceae bacterium]
MLYNDFLDTGSSFSWYRPLRRNHFICIHHGIFGFSARLLN